MNKISRVLIPLALLAMLLIVPLRSTPPAQAATGSTCAQPPAGDHTKLTDAQLAEYGLPSKADSGADWATHVNDAKHRICQSLGTKTNISAGGNNSVWAGYEAYHGTYGNGLFDHVFGEWNQFCEFEPPSPANAQGQTIMWVGLGGGDHQATEGIAQAGTAMWTNSDGSLNLAMWHETWPGDPSIIIDFDVPCGDETYTEVYYTQTSANHPTEINYFEEDDSTGFYYAPSETYPGTSPDRPDETSAEWLVERSTGILIPFSNLNIEEAGALQDDNSVYQGYGLTFSTYTLVNGSNQSMVTIGGRSDPDPPFFNFTMHWVRQS